MMRTPDWLKPVVAKLPNKSPYQKAFKPIAPMMGNLSPMSIGVSRPPAMGAIEGQSGFTGTSSPTGEIRPFNRVNRRVDEGELVLNSQDTRNVGDMAMGLVSLSRQGKLTPEVTNQIKGILGQPPEERMASGSVYTPRWSTDEEKNTFAINKALETSKSILPSGDTLKNINTLSNINNSILPSGDTLKAVSGLANTSGSILPSGQDLKTQAGISSGLINQFNTNIENAKTTAKNLAPISTPPSAGLNYQNLATGRMADISAGQSPYYAAMANKLQQEEALRNAAAQGVLNQSIAQRGLQGTGIAGAETTAQRIQQGSEVAGLAAKTAQAQMSEMAGATSALANQANTMVNQDYTRKTDAMNQLLKSGNFDQYAQAYKGLYGIDIDVNALKTADNGARMASGMSDLNTALLRPNASLSDPDVQLATNNVWLASGHTGPIDPTWANNLFTSNRAASNPVTKALNFYTPEVLTSMGLTPDKLSAYTYGGKVGKPAIDQAMMELASPGGGMHFENGNWDFDNKTSDAYNFIQGVISGTPYVKKEPVGNKALTMQGGKLYLTSDMTKPLTDTQGYEIVEYNETTKIGKTSNGDYVKVSDNGTPLPFKLKDYKLIANSITDPTERNSLLSNAIRAEGAMTIEARDMVRDLAAPKIDKALVLKAVQAAGPGNPGLEAGKAELSRQIAQQFPGLTPAQILEVVGQFM